MTKVRTIKEIEEFHTEESKDLFKELGSYLGKKVLVDFNQVSDLETPADWDGKPFETYIVGINKINCSNRGFKNNNAEFKAYPSYSRTNWCNIDIRTIIKIFED